MFMSNVVVIKNYISARIKSDLVSRLLSFKKISAVKEISALPMLKLLLLIN